MKVFISQPMKGLSNEKIQHTRDEIVAMVKSRYQHEEIEIIDSFFKDAPVDAKPLWFLAKSLELLSTADLAVFAPGFFNARGCIIEHMCASLYHIQTINLYNETDIKVYKQPIK